MIKKERQVTFDVIDYIQKNFEYNQDGTFTRHDRKNSNGSLDKDGYLILKIKGKQYKAHRLIFAYFNGRFPNGEIDHINRNRTDNRIENLRECNREDNILNTRRKPNKDTGISGIYYDRSTKGLKSRYTFSIFKKTYRFRTLKEAIEAKNRMVTEYEIQRNSAKIKSPKGFEK